MTDTPEKGSTRTVTQRPEHAPPRGKFSDEITADTLLAAYVDRMTSVSFTEEAKSTLLLEAKQYAVDLRSMAHLRQRADRNAEKTLRSHVLDSAYFLRRQREEPLKVLADWCKWIGFTWLGLVAHFFFNVSA